MPTVLGSGFLEEVAEEGDVRGMQGLWPGWLLSKKLGDCLRAMLLLGYPCKLCLFNPLLHQCC